MVQDLFGSGREQECVAVISNYKIVKISSFKMKTGRIRYLRSRESEELLDHYRATCL
jgi:hypothetical protein